LSKSGKKAQQNFYLKEKTIWHNTCHFSERETVKRLPFGDNGKNF